MVLWSGIDWCFKDTIGHLEELMHYITHKRSSRWVTLLSSSWENLYLSIFEKYDKLWCFWKANSLINVLDVYSKYFLHLFSEQWHCSYINSKRVSHSFSAMCSRCCQRCAILGSQAWDIARDYKANDCYNDIPIDLWI